MTVSKGRLGNELDIMGSENDCSYLPGRRSMMHYRVALALRADRYEALLERGWRRFGRTLFRPVCRQCSECKSLRVDVDAFRPSKSQRKARNRNSDIELTVQPPTVTDEHINLYNAFHEDMHVRRGWPVQQIDEDEYIEAFLDGDWSFSREFQYRLDGRLIALGLVDMTSRVMSSVYFVYSPDLRDRALGTMSVLREVDYAKSEGCRWLYMGYYIRECGSMNYKNRFQPHQFLKDYVADDVKPRWEAPASE